MAFPLGSAYIYKANDTAFLPDSCTPQTHFLTYVSSLFHSCLPTPLALASTTLGYLSVLSWLFAQLPQIIKNHRIKSTSGLSIYFLVEWCLGDMANLFGGLLTNQASWQIVVASYYCLVDFILVGQWLWFERLGRGSKVIAVWRQLNTRGRSPGPGKSGQAPARVTITRNMTETRDSPDTLTGDREFEERAKPRKIPSVIRSMFHTPSYGSIGSTKEGSSSSPHNLPGSERTSSSYTLRQPSPRTVLYISMVLCVLSTNVSATPVPHSSSDDFTISSIDSASFWRTLGTVLSWTSTVLYLFSRLPQLIKNRRLRSTAGLSPLMFIAAFHGNLFYSASMLTNPNLWIEVPSCDAVSDCTDPNHSWTGPMGNIRLAWMTAALPFFLGAAGVLIMDGSIGVQFLMWGEGQEIKTVSDGNGAPVEAERVLLVDAGRGLDGRRKWREVSGWMRGWMPSVSGSISAGVDAIGALRPTGSLGTSFRRASGTSTPVLLNSDPERESLLKRNEGKR